MKITLLMMAMTLLLPCSTLMTQSSSPTHTMATHPAPIPTGCLSLTIVPPYCLLAGKPASPPPPQPNAAKAL